MNKQIMLPIMSKKSIDKKVDRKKEMDIARNKFATRFLINAFLLLAIEIVLAACKSSSIYDMTISMLGFTQPANVMLSTIEVLLIATLVVGEIQDRALGILAAGYKWKSLFILNCLLAVLNSYALIACQLAPATTQDVVSFLIFNKTVNVCIPFAVTLFMIVWTISIHYNLITNFIKWCKFIKEDSRKIDDESERVEEFVSIKNEDIDSDFNDEIKEFLKKKVLEK